ncbi:hypothetical protein ANN_00703 [Periplaneta americana]|uniref:Mutator-like transposase domain-containing protein n=1 Tax=Periplaneta americana TaxID=6978 RepID=A0ABQ8TRK9_PERAM|nr:hypothetical protein ANN_00703 [Periplaneta americana]
MDLNVYGDSHPIEKEDCVNHVVKRNGTALCQLIISETKKGTNLGSKRAGSLMKNMVEKVQKYYGKAIRSNKDPAQMKTAIYAILDHYRSPDENPQHKKCPIGEDS